MDLLHGALEEPWHEPERLCEGEIGIHSLCQGELTTALEGSFKCKKGPRRGRGWGVFALPHLVSPIWAVKLNWAPGFKVVRASPWVYYTSPLNWLSLSKHFLCVFWHLSRGHLS